MSTKQPNLYPKVEHNSLPEAEDVLVASETPFGADKWHLFIALAVLSIMLLVVVVVSWWCFLLREKLPDETSPALSHESFRVDEPLNFRRLVVCHYCGAFCKKGVPCPHCGVYGAEMAACHNCHMFGRKGIPCKNCGLIIKIPTFLSSHYDRHGVGCIGARVFHEVQENSKKLQSSDYRV